MKSKSKKRKTGKAIRPTPTAQISAAGQSAEKSIIEEVPSREKTPRQLARIEKRRPLREMISKGKDPREATLMWIVNEILDDINGHWESGFPVPKDELPKLRSLLGQAREVLAEVSTRRKDLFELSPTAWFYDPIFAEVWGEVGKRSWDLEITRKNLAGILYFYPKLKSVNGFKKDLREHTDLLSDLLPKVHDDTAMLYVTIGFALGAREYKEQVSRNLGAMKVDLLERFTIEPANSAMTEAAR